MKMERCICDICQINEADVKLKVKMNEKKGRYTQGHGARSFFVGFGNWERIDICESCYKKILGVEIPNPVIRPLPPTCR